MKNKIVKSGTVVLIVVCLLSLSCFSASALSVGGGASIEGTYGRISYTQSDIEYSTQNGGSIDEPNDRRINFNIPVGPNAGDGIWTSELQFTFQPGSFIYGKLTLYVTLIGSSSALYYGQPFEGLQDRSTGSLLAQPQIVGTNKFKMEYTGYIPSKMRTVLYFNYVHGVNPDNVIMALYDVTFQPIDKGSQDIIDNQNENADKIMNGWSGGPSVDNSTAGDFEQAESNALGGKSDSEIQAEVNNSLEFDMGSLDWDSSRKLNVFMDGCLTAFGSKFMTLLLLALTLGLAAFLIGRRYG